MCVWFFYFDLCHIKLSVDRCWISDTCVCVCVCVCVCGCVCVYQVSQYYAGVQMLTAVTIFGSAPVSYPYPGNVENMVSS
jgi:hypothetical protein